MGEVILNFNNIKVKQSTFYKSKYPIDIHEADIENIGISDRLLYCKKCFKHFIKFKDDKKIKSLSIMLPKISRYVKCFDETIYMSLLIKDVELLEAYMR